MRGLEKGRMCNGHSPPVSCESDWERKPSIIEDCAGCELCKQYLLLESKFSKHLFYFRCWAQCFPVTFHVRHYYSHFRVEVRQLELYESLSNCSKPQLPGGGSGILTLNLAHFPWPITTSPSVESAADTPGPWPLEWCQKFPPCPWS